MSKVASVEMTVHTASAERDHRTGRVRSAVRCAVACIGLFAMALSAGVAAAVSFPGSTASAASDLPLINGGGSSYAAVAINQWASEASILHGMNINYATSSSVQGLNEFALNELNFGASEIGYSTKQADYKAPAGYQYLPDVAGAECIDYNLHAVNGSKITELLLTPSVEADIFTGQIKSWNAPAIKALNPQVLLPNEPIVVTWREDPSGDNYLFSQYLNAVASSIWQPFDKALGYYANHNFATAIWPQPNGEVVPKQYNLRGWVGESGSDNASYYVSSTEGAITYVETAYAIEHGDPCAYIENASHHFVQPSAYNDAVALTKAQLLPDLEQELGAVYTNSNPDAYPISAYSYLLTYETGYSSQMAAELGSFIQFFACYGQQSAVTLGYSPLPPILVERDFQAVDRIVGAAKAPPAPTPANCSDPYVNGTLPFPGGPNVAGSGGGSSTTSPSGTTGNNPGGSSTQTSGGSGPTGSGPTGASKKKGGASKTSTSTTVPANDGVTEQQVAHQHKASNNGIALLGATTGLEDHVGPSPGRAALLFVLSAAALLAPGAFLALRQRKRRRST